MSAYRAPLIGALVAVLLTVGFWFLLYSPKVDEREALEAETAQLEQEQATLRQRIAQLEAIAADQPRIAAQLARLEEYVPDDPAQPSALVELQETADAAGVEIVEVAFGDPLPADPATTVGPGEVLGELTVSMTLRGGYFQAVDFFRRIEHDNARAVLVESIDASEGEDGFPQLDVAWNGRLFTALDDAEDPGQAATAGGTGGGDASRGDASQGDAEGEGDADSDAAGDDDGDAASETSAAPAVLGVAAVPGGTS